MKRSLGNQHWANRYWGCHVSAAGGLGNAIRNGQELGVNTIQIHASPPQRWNFAPFAAGIENEFLELVPKSGIERVFFHGIYLINLASLDEAVYSRSRTSLIHALELMARISGNGVIFHLGSMKDHSDEKIGYRRAADAINVVLEKSKNEAKLLLEVAAGSGKVIGDRMEELAEIYELVENKERVAFALDSQHLWASGYDLRTDLDGVVAQAEQILTLEKIEAFHLNDSKTKLGSRVDRHENLGDGELGMEAIKKLVLHPKLAHIPFILETPHLKEMEAAKKEVQTLRSIVNAG